MGSSPTKKYRYGNCSLSQFENQNTKDGKSFTTVSYTPQKSYKVGDETKFTNSFKPNELTFLIQCCMAALDDYYRKDEMKPVQQSGDNIPF